MTSVAQSFRAVAEWMATDPYAQPPQPPAEGVGDTPPETPEPVQNEPTPALELDPAAALAAHIAVVREQGDALRVPSMQLRSSFKLTAVASATGGLLWTAAPNLPTMIAESVVATVVTGAIAYVPIFKRSSKIRETVETRTDNDSQAALNAHYELYALPKKKDSERELAMRWYGPIDNEDGKTGSEFLTDIATKAKEAGVSQLVVDVPLARECGSADLPGANDVPLSTWLHGAKGLRINGRAKTEMLRVGTPDDWLEFVQRSGEGGFVTAVLERIRALSDQHTAPKVGAEFATDADVQRERLLSVLKTGLESYLGSDFSRNGRAYGRQLSLERVEGGQTLGMRHNVATKIVGDEVHTMINGLLTRKASLESALELGDVVRLQNILAELPELPEDSPKAAQEARRDAIKQAKGEIEKQLQQMLDNPALGSKRVHILEYVLYKSLLQRKPLIELDGVGKQTDRKPLVPKSPHMVQEELALNQPPAVRNERLSRWAHRRRRLGMALAGLALSGGVLGGVTAVGDNQYHHREQEATQDIIRDHGMDPAHAMVAPGLAQHRVDSWNAVNKPWDYTMDRRNKLSGWAGDGLHELGNLLGFGSDTSSPLGGQGGDGAGEGIGNTPDYDNPTTYNPVVWNLEPHNMDPTGYWIQGVSWVLHGDTTPNGPDMHWDMKGQYADADIQYEWPTTLSDFDAYYGPAAGPNAMSIRVTGNADSNDLVQGDSGFFYLPLPVLDNGALAGRVVGVKIDGNPNVFVETREGTYAARFKNHPGKGDMTVEYIVAPLGKRPHPRLSAIHEMVVEGSMPNAKMSWVVDYLDKRIPGYKAADAYDKVRLLGDYLQHDLSYKYSPLTDEDIKNITGWPEYIRTILHEDAANCNLSATFAALSALYKQLNVAVGFSNAQGTGSNVLQLSEGHMVNLQQKVAHDQSSILDFTPQTAIITSDTGRPHEGGGHSVPWPDPIEAAAGLVLLAAGIAKRRRILQLAANGRDAVATARADRAVDQLEKMETSVLRYAAAIARQAAYGKDHQVVPSAAQSAAANEAVSKEQAVSAVQKPYMYAKETRGHLKQQAPGVVTPAARKALRLGSRASRRPERTSRKR
jgi:hypothetical protein